MRPSLALALVAFTPGCLTAGLWEWARDDSMETYKAVAIEEVVPAADGGFVVHLRMADGSAQTSPWVGEHARGPTAAYADACQAAGGGQEDAAVRHLERAVRRGLTRRDFLSDPALSPIAARSEVPRLAAEAVRPPALILRDEADDDSWVEVVHLAPPELPEAIIDVQPVSFEVAQGGPLGYVVAVIATPVSFVLDVVTFPGQVIVALWVIDSLFDF